MHVHFCLGEMFYKCQLGPFSLWSQINPAFLCLFFVLLIYLLVRIRYWCCSLSVCEDQCYLSCSCVTFIKLGTLVFVKTCNTILVEFSSDVHVSFLINFGFYSIFVRYENGYLSLFLRSFCVKCLFLSIYPEMISILDSKIIFLDATEGLILFFNSFF